MQFYVYEWYRKFDNFIFYVGKGTKYRKQCIAGRNKLFLEYIDKYECANRIIFETDDEESAYFYEEYRINRLKEIDQATCNLRTDYGVGGYSNYSTINKMLNDNSIQRQEQRIRMTINNPMKNYKTVEKVRNKLLKTIIIGNMIFRGRQEAAKYFKVSTATISNWIKVGKLPTKYGNLECRYDNQQPSQVNVDKK